MNNSSQNQTTTLSTSEKYGHETLEHTGWSQKVKGRQASQKTQFQLEDENQSLQNFWGRNSQVTHPHPSKWSRHAEIWYKRLNIKPFCTPTKLWANPLLPFILHWILFLHSRDIKPKLHYATTIKWPTIVCNPVAMRAKSWFAWAICSELATEWVAISFILTILQFIKNSSMRSFSKVVTSSCCFFVNDPYSSVKRK